MERHTLERIVTLDAQAMTRKLQSPPEKEASIKAARQPRSAECASLLP